MNLQLERWVSDHNRCERHYFRVDGRQHGYQGEREYVFGINPEVVKPEREKMPPQVFEEFAGALEILLGAWEHMAAK